MDRTTAIAGGAIVAVASLWLSGQFEPSAPAQPALTQLSIEPARLDLGEISVKPMPSSADNRVVSTAFPFFGSRKAETAPAELELITPESVTPSLAVPKQSVIELPSAAATPAPVERVPMVTAEPELPTERGPVPSISPPQPVVPSRPAPLAAAVARAEQMTAEGLELAQRGAIFSARSQFLKAVRHIASAQDQINSTTRYTQALNEALKAMQESHDFSVRHATDSNSIDVGRIVAGHRTEVLKLEDLSEISPAAANDRYQLFAVKQITTAIGDEPVGSMPLFGLGRISAASSKANTAVDIFGSNDALVWYHAALMADATNFRAAHELGSLYAARGEWERARTVLQRAIAVQPHPTTWGNLAIVHSKLGEHDWAAAARARAGNVNMAPTASGTLPPVEWVDASTFAKSTGPNEVFFPQQTQPQGTASTPSAQPEPRSAAKPKSGASWLPWTSQRR